MFKFKVRVKRPLSHHHKCGGQVLFAATVAALLARQHVCHGYFSTMHLGHTIRAMRAADELLDDLRKAREDSTLGGVQGDVPHNMETSSAKAEGCSHWARSEATHEVRNHATIPELDEEIIAWPNDTENGCLNVKESKYINQECLAVGNIEGVTAENESFEEHNTRLVGGENIPTTSTPLPHTSESEYQQGIRHISHTEGMGLEVAQGATMETILQCDTPGMANDSDPEPEIDMNIAVGLEVSSPANGVGHRDQKWEREQRESKDDQQGTTNLEDLEKAAIGEVLAKREARDKLVQAAGMRVAETLQGPHRTSFNELKDFAYWDGQPEGEGGDRLSPEELRALETVAICGDRDGVLLAFLRHAKFDLEKAKTSMRRCCAWRMEIRADEMFSRKVSPAKIRKHRSCWPTGFHGEDREGRPVFYDRVGQADLPALRTDPEAMDLDEMVQIFCLNMEARRRFVLTRLSREAGRPVDQMTTVMDLSGLGRRHMTKEAISYTRRIGDIFQDNFSGMTRSLLLVNAPWVFTKAWQMIEGFLSEDTVAKIKVVGKGEAGLESLARYIPRKNIPDFLGGTSPTVLGPDDPLWVEVDAAMDAWAEGRDPFLDQRELCEVISRLREERLQAAVVSSVAEDLAALSETAAESSLQGVVPGTSSVGGQGGGDDGDKDGDGQVGVSEEIDEHGDVASGVHAKATQPGRDEVAMEGRKASRRITGKTGSVRYHEGKRHRREGKSPLQRTARIAGSHRKVREGAAAEAVRNRADFPVKGDGGSGEEDCEVGEEVAASAVVGGVNFMELAKRVVPAAKFLVANGVTLAMMVGRVVVAFLLAALTFLRDALFEQVEVDD